MNYCNKVRRHFQESAYLPAIEPLEPRLLLSSEMIISPAPNLLDDNLLIDVVDSKENAEASEANASHVVTANLPTYELLRVSMLTPKTRWTYDFTIYEFENKWIDRDSTATVSVASGPKILGIPTMKMTHTVKGMYSDWEYVGKNLDGYVIMGFGSSGFSFTATDPLMVMPEFISEGDNDVHLDEGRFTGRIDGVSGKIVVEADSYVSFYGTETLVTPAGTFDCVIININIQMQLSNGWSIYQNLTWWIDPDAGPIRRDCVETTYTPHRENTSHSATQLRYTNAQGRPDLHATVASLPANRVPGDKVVLPVRVTNTGKGTAFGKMNITLYASPTGELDGSEIEIGRLTNQTVKIAVGSSKTFKATITLPSLPQGNYVVIAIVDSGSSIEEIDESNNVATSEQAVEVLWQFGNFADRKNVKIIVTDLQGQRVTVAMTGPGSGKVVSVDGQFEVGVTGSTPSTKLNITPAGKRTISSIVGMVVEGSLKSITAPNVDLAGPMYVLGSLGALKMHDALAGSEIVLGRSYENGPLLDGIISSPSSTCTISLYRVTDTRIESSLQALRSISAREWMDSDPQWDIVAPRLDTLAINGDFQADISLGSVDGTGKALGSLTILGMWHDSNIMADGSCVRTGQSIAYLKAGQVGSVNVTATGGIASIYTSDWQSGSISAGWIGTVTTKANRTLRTAGNFGGDLQLSGNAVPAKKATLGAAKIAGDLLAGTIWDVQAGIVGPLTFAGTVRESVVRSADSIRSITLGASDRSDFAAGVDIGIIQANRHAATDDQANTPKARIGTFTVTGFKVAKGAQIPRFFVDSCISAGITKLSLLNWDDQGGLYAAADSVGSVKHRDTANRLNNWNWPAPATQVSNSPDNFVHLI